jgi:threonine/homoserine efflux transporter RhtA
MLMKWGLFDENLQPTLSAYQVAAIRIASSGLVMIPFLPKALKGIPKNLIFTVLLSGWLGSFLQHFYFALPKQKLMVHWQEV